MNAASGDAVLFVSVSTLEKGVINTKEVTISQIEKGSVSLFNDIVAGATDQNSTLKVTIARQAGTGSDSAQYAIGKSHDIFP